MKFINRRRILKIIGVASLGGVAGATIINAQNHKLQKVTWEGISLGAPSEITIYHSNRKHAEIALKNSLHKLFYLENLFSLYNKNSQLSLLNKNGIIHSPDPEMINLLSLSKKYSNITNGAFDITVQPLWNLYKESFKNSGKAPTQKKIIETLNLVNINNIDIKKNQIKYLVKGMSSTFNGIAQGYITDKVAEVLIESGINNTLVQIGEYRGIGEHPDKRPWRLLISNPEHSTTIGSVEFVNTAVATSAGMGTVFENSGKYNHIFDPQNGSSPNKHLQNTVTAKTATEADALSTAFLIMGEKESSLIAKKRKIGFEILDIKRNRKIITTI